MVTISAKRIVTVGRTLDPDLFGIGDRYFTCTNPHWFLFPTDGIISFCYNTRGILFSAVQWNLRRRERTFFPTLLFELCVKRRRCWKGAEHSTGPRITLFYYNESLWTLLVFYFMLFFLGHLIFLPMRAPHNKRLKYPHSSFVESIIIE